MNPKVGLALAGGGARGAYQVGVIKAYVEQGGQVDALAGSSVGAINAAVLASAPSMAEGVKRLKRIWLEDVPLLRLVLTLSNALDVLESTLRVILPVATRIGPEAVRTVKAVLDELDRGLLSARDLKEHLSRRLDPSQLEKGPPVHVAVYKSQGALLDVARVLLAEAGILDTPRSTFQRLQDCTSQEQLVETVLASAAIPVLFSARGGEGRLADGGIGGWQTSQGHTPVDPLMREGCEVVVVSHLSADSRWSRNKNPNLTVVEITPSGQIGNGSLAALFERDPKVLESWLKQGHEDATRQLGRLREAFEARNRLAKSHHAIAESENTRERAEARRRDVMTRLTRSDQ